MSQEKTKNNTTGFQYIVMILVASTLAFFVAQAITNFITDTAIAKSIEKIEKTELENNVCVVERTGASYEEDKFAVHYKMDNETFDINCYEELMSDLNEQTFKKLLFNNYYVQSAYLDWNGKKYAFEKPDSGDIVTENNVHTLIQEVK